ncbi:hypothetical protein K7432_017244 [Basidiobolus ranarum]|uniref:Uncharacterized protein n=1 Tax=Basidiobolus ranarum TaxID=34480 RepID=A0ABR2VKL4_9FUNG
MLVGQMSSSQMGVPSLKHWTSFTFLGVPQDRADLTFLGSMEMPDEQMSNILWDVCETLGKDLVLPGHSGEGTIPRNPNNYKELNPKAIHKDADNLDDAWNKITNGLKQKISQKLVNKKLLTKFSRNWNKAINSRNTQLRESTDSDVGIGSIDLKDICDASKIHSVSKFNTLVAFKEILPDDILPNGIENFCENMENNMESVKLGDLVANTWDDDNIWDKIASKLINYINDKKLTKAQYKALCKGMGQWSNSLKKDGEELNCKETNGEARETNELSAYKTHYKTYSLVVKAASKINISSMS